MPPRFCYFQNTDSTKKIPASRKRKMNATIYTKTVHIAHNRLFIFVIFYVLQNQKTYGIIKVHQNSTH